MSGVYGREGIKTGTGTEGGVRTLVVNSRFYWDLHCIPRSSTVGKTEVRLVCMIRGSTRTSISVTL